MKCQLISSQRTAIGWIFVDRSSSSSSSHRRRLFKIWDLGCRNIDDAPMVERRWCRVHRGYGLRGGGFGGGAACSLGRGTKHYLPFARGKLQKHLTSILFLRSAWEFFADSFIKLIQSTCFLHCKPHLALNNLSFEILIFIVLISNYIFFSENLYACWLLLTCLSPLYSLGTAEYRLIVSIILQLYCLDSSFTSSTRVRYLTLEHGCMQKKF